MDRDIGAIVKEDYAALVQGRAAAELAAQTQTVCCSEAYDRTLMKNVPKPVVDAEFGCGNPTRFIQPGDTVLDIGSGAGMNCYVAAQVAGPEGRVFGVDFNEAMLEIARREQAGFAEKVSAAPMSFHLGSAHDLALDLEKANAYLAENPPGNVTALQAYLDAAAKFRKEQPLIPDNSIDVVISNCVINLLGDSNKPEVFREIFRVLKPGGRFAVSDNVSNRPVPEELKTDTQLWSACYAGVLQEQAFYEQLEKAGFTHLHIDTRNPEPARVVEDLTFYSITVTGRKPLQGAEETTPRVIYRGPAKGILGNSGKMYRRGQPEALASVDRDLLSNDAFIVADGTAEVASEPASACCG